MATNNMPQRIDDYLAVKTVDGWVVRHALLGEVISQHSDKASAIAAAKRYAADGIRP